MFADIPKTIIDKRDSLFWETVKRTQKVRDTIDGLNPIPKQDRLTPPVTLSLDECNITITYDPPTNFFFKDVYHLPGFSYTYRNPMCSPPPPPPAPGPKSFYVDGAGCGVTLTFAFYITGDSKVLPGAGYGIWYFGGDVPHGAEVLSPSPTEQSGYGLKQSFDYEGDDFRIFQLQPLDTDGHDNLLQEGILIYFSPIGYSADELASKGGWVTPNLPNYHLFTYHKDSGTFTKSIVSPPWALIKTDYGTCDPTYSKQPPPPPPPPPKECECMCCPDQQNNDALLKLILKRIGNLPANVPDNFAKQSPSMINVESLAELMLWQMQQLDALMGAYPIEIEIEDSDLVTEGNQKQKISVPNQAEAIAEILGLLLTTKRDTHATLITAIKTMGEAGMAKNLGIKTLDVALANAEFLGYKLEQKKKKVPSLFTPGGKDMSETLKEKDVEIITYENTDKKDLQDDLKTLLTMAARWNAQNWRKLGSDAKADLIDRLINNPTNIAEAGNKRYQDDFNQFTEEAERGFIEITGITNTEDPWGRPYNERPKIREIGSEEGRYDADGKEKPVQE